MEIRQGVQDWFAASELVIVLIALLLSVVLVTNRDELSGFRQAVSSASPKQVNHPDLQVLGTGTAAPTGSSRALQSASPIQQSGESGQNIQQNNGRDKQLQPNTGQSTFSNQQMPQ
jgi:hypothetical protein